MFNKNKTCETCKYWHYEYTDTYNDSIGKCLRYPPTFEQCGRVRVYIETFDNNPSCGEYKKKWL